MVKNRYFASLTKVKSKSLIDMVCHWRCLYCLLFIITSLSSSYLQVYKPLLERFKALEDKITCLDWIFFFTVDVSLSQANVPGEINVCESSFSEEEEERTKKDIFVVYTYEKLIWFLEFYSFVSVEGMIYWIIFFCSD